MLSKKIEDNPSPPHEKKHNTRMEWLSGQSGATPTFCRPTPPEPISGAIEGHHEPDEPLSDYRDERRWSDEIIAWSKDHALELSLEPVAYEE